jgi:transporter family protein
MDYVGFAVISAIAAGSYSVLQRMTAPAINQAFGALLISITAATISLVILLLTRNERPLYTDSRVFPLIALIGLTAFSVDFFSLLAYSRGLSVSVGAPISVGVSIATASIAGFAMGESVTAPKLVGIALIIVGALFLGTTPMTK